MIRNDLCYALTAGRPMLIDPLKAKAFLDNANLILSNPDIAYHLSAWSDKYDNKEGRSRRRSRAGSPWETEADDGEMENFFSSVTAPEVKDGMGVIPVEGVIGKGLTKIERMLGCTDLGEIAKIMDAWEKRDDINEIVFKFDSGGGSTSGLEEMSKKIRNYSKPTAGYCESDCGSAAFWLASQCNSLFVTPSSSIGAVGIYLTLKDLTEKHKEDGINVVIIKSGEYKAAGVENTALTSLQFQRLQDEVIELHRRFIRDVKSVRVFVDEADLQGQSFYGDEAVRRGLATNLVDEWKQAVEIIKYNRSALNNSAIARLFNQKAII